MATPYSGSHITRFAPSPTGLLHIGHAYAALTAYHARGSRGSFLLRIEDIDFGRCHEEYVDAIQEDLAWLGLGWETPIRRQSEHLADYRNALGVLEHANMIYPCFCTRAEIQAEINRSGRAPHAGEWNIYPGICRDLSAAERTRKIAQGIPHASRLDVNRAVMSAKRLTWVEAGKPVIKAHPEDFGDVVVARKDTPTSYHLAVTVDDHIQGITLVTRGEDLGPQTDIHRLLQHLLGYRTPEYFHHRLVTDSSGRRISKRDNARSIRSLRMEGHSPTEVIAMSGFEA